MTLAPRAQRRARHAALAILGALLLETSPAQAIFIPALDLPSQKQADAERSEPYWDTFARRTIEEFRRPVGGVALSFDYRYSEQDFINTVPPALPGGMSSTIQSRSELNSFTLRPEFVPFNWASVYGIGAIYDGSNKARGLNVSLDGWGAGVGTTLSLGLPRYLPCWWKAGAIDPLFILPDVNWTHNEFDGINESVEVINVTTRVGAGARTRLYNWGVYGGPMYQTATRDLSSTVATPTGPATFTYMSEPKDAWSGVVGAFFGVRISDKPKAQQRPTLLATIEGGVGNREGVLFTLRYEYDFFRSPPPQVAPLPGPTPCHDSH